MKYKKIAVILLFSCTAVGLFSCGSKEKESNEDISSEATESLKTTEPSEKATDDTERLLDNMILDIDADSVAAVSIRDGSTGNEVKKIENGSDKTAFFQQLSEVEFKTIETENYTGWKYAVTITKADGDEIKITVTSNEAIHILYGEEQEYYRTDFDLSGYLSTIVEK